MSTKVAEIKTLLGGRDSLATDIALLWKRHNDDRHPWLEEKKELRNYLFATDTTKTNNSVLPWKNKTTLPKLTEIRDNLHSNYLAALFPNDNWMKWEAYTPDAAKKEIVVAIQTYLENKTRMGGYREVVSDLLLDYIDWGNAFAEVEYCSQKVKDVETGEDIPGYIGPKLKRISPFDIVFNPKAASFKDTYKIIRYMKTIGELEADAQDDVELGEDFRAALAKAKEFRTKIGGYKVEDWNKAQGFQVDGFGTMMDYLDSGFVEILRFEGDIHDRDGNLLRNHRIMVIDRSFVISKKPIPSWLGDDTIFHVAWRKRPDNLYGMGPLDNLVGMQYRIDHLENLKADVFDTIAHPVFKIYGDVEAFDYKPGEEIHIDEGGDVQMMNPDVTALNADNQIAILERKMEEFAGAPREAMGIRTPGEKTAFEVQRLENASGRIFQNKITNFEIFIIEPSLNGFLEVSRRNMDGSDMIRVMDDDIAVVTFMQITKEDITAQGHIRPIGARHFAAQAQLMQNLASIANTPLWAETAAHRSSKKLAKLIEESLLLGRFAIFEENAAIFEQADTQAIAAQAQEDVMTEQATPIEDII